MQSVSNPESLGNNDLFRGIREQLASLLDGLDPKDLATMSLGLSHSLSRWELSIVKPTSVLNLRLIQVQTQVLSGQGGHDGNSSHRSVRRPRQGDQHLLDEGEGNARSIIRVLL